MSVSTFNAPTPSRTASLASSYIPHFSATSPFPGAISSAAHPFSAPNPNPSTPALQDDHQWITTYLDIHKLSTPSYRYMYMLWIVVALAFLIFMILRWSDDRLTTVAALWHKWSLRRRTWRKQHSLAKARRRNEPHRQPLSLPSNAQLLSIAILYIATILLCFLGPDYIAPGTHVWDLSHNLTSRQLTVHLDTRASRVPPPSATSQPTYTIPKAWWTAGGRTGTIVFALLPLCVLFALKSPPFALFALPFLVELYNDKLAFIHRWTGRLIWFVTALHIAFWGVQLSHDKRGTDNPASVWSFAFGYDKFVFGWLGFISLTLLVALSLRPVRIEFYEAFYALHVLLVPATLIFSALHFPPIGSWCWITLLLWGAERLWRLVRFVGINGIIRSNKSRRSVRYAALVRENAIRGSPSGVPWVDPQNQAFPYRHARISSYATQASKVRPILSTDLDAIDVTDDRTFELDYKSRPTSIGQETVKSFQTGSTVELLSHPGTRTFPYPHSPGPFPPTNVLSAPQSSSFGSSSRSNYIPPPGYAHATLLSGRTVRLRLITPRPFTWAPGQHVLLNVPSVSKFTSHPFTIASVYDAEARSDEQREIVILVRARTGFTKDLWSHVDHLETSGQVGDTPSCPFSRPKRGVLLRAYVDGPFGSSIRARWASYSTVLVIAGGSGVSFGTAILEYACICMTGRSGRQLGGPPGWGRDVISQINRVRFVWIVREFSHIQWVASQVRRCMDMVSPSTLQVDIFVTNVVENPRPALTFNTMPPRGSDTLPLPSPDFARSERSTKGSSPALNILMESGTSEHFNGGLNSRRGDETEIDDLLDMYGDLGHEAHVLDLTNFDGEDDSALPGESQLSQRLRKEGKLRRAQTRKSVLLAKHESGQRVVGHSLHPAYGAHTSKSPSGSSSTTPISSVENFQSPATPFALRTPTSHDPLILTTPFDTPITPMSSHSLQPNPLFYGTEEKPRSVSPAPSNWSEGVDRVTHDTRTRLKFDLDEAEAQDMHIVSERARPGRAKIDQILADEAGRSQGAMIVACCGPTSLTAMVRKHVAARIGPSRIMRGDMRARITLVSEDFEW